jgi:phage shock protein PspC (stress-responsive transcriptional regulator)
MNKVITVNLNGSALHLDEDSYAALHDYLSRAEAKLQGPDKREVTADLEQAIADKIASLLRPHKNVIAKPEMMGILNEIGPVQTTDGPTIEVEPSNTRATSPPSRPERPDRIESAPRRFYRIREGSAWTGVCTGIAAYADMNVYLVRVITVLATIVTGIFFGLILYFVITMIVPIAYTNEEFTAAHARPPALRRN